MDVVKVIRCSMIRFESVCEVKYFIVDDAMSGNFFFFFLLIVNSTQNRSREKEKEKKKPKAIERK